MEYQSFFMLLKTFEYTGGKFYSNNPLQAHGYIQTKKEQHEHSVVIQINNFTTPTFAYVVCENNIAKIKVSSSCTKANLGFELTNNVYVFIDDYKLFACKNNTQDCLQAYELLLLNKNKPKGKTTLEKIFGKVYDTYFYDCIKPKLASLFSMGKPCDLLNNYFSSSKWVQVEQDNISRYFGILYKDNFVYAIAVASNVQDEPEGSISYQINNKNYNILFLSAENGKIINF